MNQWQLFALQEIDKAVSKGRKLNLWQQKFIDSVRGRIQRGIDLTDKQDAELQKLYESKTDPKRLKW